MANLTLLAPEQSRYTTSLTIVPDDLTKNQDNYVFLPSLRRSLRLSSAARCAPLLGSDYTPDDKWRKPRCEVSMSPSKACSQLQSRWLKNMMT